MELLRKCLIEYYEYAFEYNMLLSILLRNARIYLNMSKTEPKMTVQAKQLLRILRRI